VFVNKERPNNLNYLALITICLLTATNLVANEPLATPSTCVDCHQQQHQSWSASDHFHAMASASLETVLGDFNNAKFEFEGFSSVFFMHEGRFYCKTQDEKNELSTFEISHVFGITPLQQYLVQRPTSTPPPAGHMPKTQVLPFAWDVNKKAWYHIYAHDPPAPGDPIHWTGWAQNWNHMCADCHVTTYKKEYDHQKKDYTSSYQAGYVDCGACHQMKEDHYSSAKKNLDAKKSSEQITTHPLIDFQKQKNEMQACAPCHAHREHLSEGFTPKSKLEDHYAISLLSEDLYHHDGQIKEEVYVMGSFLQSKMYRMGVRCSNCHDPHSLKIKLPNNGVCAQCHDPKVFDAPTHHHHAENSTGARCIECHMPESVYMGIDRRRDHSIRIPRPDLSQKVGAPNACTGCHLEESRRFQAEQYQGWLREAQAGQQSKQQLLAELDQKMALAFKKWYGDEARPPHYGEVFHGVRTHEIQDPSSLLAISDNVTDYGPLTRATAIDLMRYFPTWRDSNLLMKWAKDDSSLVRRAVASSQYLDLIPSTKLDLMNDSARSVRIATLRSLLTQPEQIENDPNIKACVLAMRSDLNAYLIANGDQAGAHVLWAQYQQALGQTKEAITAYQTAIELQPELTGSRSALAQLKENAGEHETAKKLRLEEMDLLRRDLRLAPDRSDIWYRLGLMSYILNDEEATLRSMNRVLSLEPNHYNAGIFVIQLNERKGKWSEVKRAAIELLEHYPQDGYLRQMAQKSMQQAR